MLGAIGSSAINTATGAGKPAAGLEAQLAHYQIQLADWVNCPSCKTEVGKAKIAQISAKISEVKQGIAVAAANKEESRPVSSDLAALAGSAKSAVGGNGAAVDARGSRSGQRAGTVGSRLDVFA